MKVKLILTIAIIAGLLSAAFISIASAYTHTNWLQDVVFIAHKGSEGRTFGCGPSNYPVTYDDKGTLVNDGYYGCIIVGDDYDYLVDPSTQILEKEAQVYAVRKHSDNTATFHRIDQSNRLIIFYPESGTILEREGDDNSKHVFRVYENSSNAFLSVHDGNGNITEYELDHSSSLVNAYTFEQRTIDIVMSPNGKWLYTTYREDNNLIMAKINIENRVISRGTLTHDLISNDSPRIRAASNDGNWLYAETGMSYTRIRERMIYSTQSCSVTTETCQQRNLKAVFSGEEFENAYTGSPTIEPKFSSDSSTLELWGNTGDKYTLSLIEIDDGRLDYLALGDSFSSGEGDVTKHENTDSNYRYWTDRPGDPSKGIPREMCHVSERAYPFLLANGMGLGNLLTDGTQEWGIVACSGATTGDMNGVNSENYEGQNLENNIPRLQGTKVEELKATALDEMIPGRQKQIEFVKKYQPKTITLTIGGNDVYFGNIVRACVSPLSVGGGEFTQTCSYAQENHKKAIVSKTILKLRDDLISLYSEIKSVGGPDVKLYVLGYPQFVNDQVAKTNNPRINATTCGLNVRLNYDERRMVVNATKLLNSVIRSAAEEVGAIYINTEDAFTGYQLCDKGIPSAVNGITGMVNNNESFHPNSYGHSLLARRVWEATDGETLQDYVCRDGQYVTCPGGSMDPVKVPDYFKLAMSDNVEVVAGNSIAPDIIKVGSLFLLLSPPTGYALLAHTAYTVLLYSIPTNLGTYITDENGLMSRKLLLPQSLSPGYHTLEITGTGTDGKPLIFWKIIEVRSADDNDYDGDGIPNVIDRCQYIRPTGIDLDNDGLDDGCDPHAPLPGAKDIENLYLAANSSKAKESRIEATTSSHTMTSADGETKLPILTEASNTYIFGSNNAQRSSIWEGEISKINTKKEEKMKQHDWRYAVPIVMLISILALGVILILRRIKL